MKEVKREWKKRQEEEVVRLKRAKWGGGDSGVRSGKGRKR